VASTPREASAALLKLGRAAPSQLVLKLAAPVIATRRISPTIATGTVGSVLSLTSEACVCVFKGKRVTLSVAQWDVFDEAGAHTGTRRQLPVILAWAITIHRAQGSQLDFVCIDLMLDDWACDGLVYTALSRVPSFRSLCVRGLKERHVKISAVCNTFWLSLLE